MTDRSAEARGLADATARVSDPLGRLVGERSQHATDADAAHWIATYTELLSFKAELLEITAKRRLSMSKDARREADDDFIVLSAQADKYSRRLREWSAHLATGDATESAPVPLAHEEEDVDPVAELSALSVRVSELSAAVAAALVAAEADADAAEPVSPRDGAAQRPTRSAATNHS